MKKLSANIKLEIELDEDSELSDETLKKFSSGLNRIVDTMDVKITELALENDIFVPDEGFVLSVVDKPKITKGKKCF